MKLIGITGGIGTGKSAVAGLLKARGWTVYASDETAKQIMASDPEVRKELTEAFGPDVLTEQGVNAPFLASLVFGPTEEHHARLARLNQIVHPRVLDAHMEAIEREHAAGTSIVAIESALLYEVDLEEGFDWVIVVDAPHDVCVARVMERSNTTAAEVERRMAEQLSMEEKRGLADFVIENGSTLADLERATTMVATIIEVFPDPEH
jgi:dephospho-CoA kinase